jgi:thymidine phosphorylase
LPRAPVIVDVPSDRAGWVTSVDPLELALTALELGAGRTRAEDTVEPDVGIEITAPRGVKVKKGVALARVHAKTKQAAKAAAARVKAAFTVADASFPPPPLVIARIDG